MGRIPLYIHRKILIRKYWIKLISLNRNCLLYKCYSKLRNDAENNQSYNNTNWAFNIKSILENCGLGNIWQTQDTISQQENNNTIQTIELRIKDTARFK